VAWENRGGSRYYTRSRKVNGRVIREYVGGGLPGLLAEQEDDERRQRRAEARARRQRDQDAFAAASQSHEELSRVADALIRATLISAGYHQHDRGQWRKRRVSKVNE
jgi:hypothetical protein